MTSSQFCPGRRVELTPGRYHRLLQVIGAIPLESSAAQERLNRARDIALDWLEKKKRVRLGSAAKAGESWDYEASDSTRVLNIETSPGLWAFRFDDPEDRGGARVWRVELVLTLGDNNAPLLMGCTLSVMAPAGSESSVAPSVPAVVTKIANELGFYDDNRSLSGVVADVDRDSDVDQLFALIESRNRNRAVVVVAQASDESIFFSPEKMARDLAGIAHVVKVSPEASWEITRRYGKELSVFDDAVRLYRVGFDADVDSPYRHPLYLARSWRERSYEMQSRIRFDAISDTVARPSEKTDVPSFSVIRRAAADRRLRAVAASLPPVEDIEAAKIHRIEVERAIAQLTASAKSWEDMALDEEKVRLKAEQDRFEAISRLSAQQHRIDYLQKKLAEFGVDDTPSWPDSFGELSAWSERYLAGRVVVVNKAVRAAQRSVFSEIPLAYKALHHLATTYWEMRVEGGAVLEQATKQVEMVLGLERSATGKAARDRRYESEYQVRYEGDTFKLDQHLVGSNSRDERRCLRVYFCWDAERQLVIVGHLPTHLTNSLT